MTVAAPTEPSIACPLCDYDLRGLVEPRCPECGYRFTWEEIRDPQRRRHPYLFEHHPRRNVHSFFKTMSGGLRPRRFWSMLYPTQPSNVPRLLLYFAIVCLSGLLPAAVVIAREAQEVYARAEVSHRWMVQYFQDPAHAVERSRYRAFTPQQIANLFAPMPTWRTLAAQLGHINLWSGAAAITAAPVGWIALTTVAMLIFSGSMRRARVRPVHALRCILYSADVLAWANIAFFIVAVTVLYRNVGNTERRRVDETVYGPVLVTIMFLAWTVFAYRLVVAIRRYLRFDHAVATVLAMQVVVLLVVLVFLFRVLGG